MLLQKFCVFDLVLFCHKQQGLRPAACDKITRDQSQWPQREGRKPISQQSATQQITHNGRTINKSY